MATHVLIDMPAPENGRARPGEGRARCGTKIHLRQSSVFTEREGCVYVSTAAALRGARGVLFALGLQAAVAMAAGGAWLVWHTVR